jgi:hypothetical protein
LVYPSGDFVASAQRFRGENCADRPGTAFASAGAMNAGRSAAYFAHPAAAWRRLGNRHRLLLVTAYFGTAYLLTLGTLYMIQ